MKEIFEKKKNYFVYYNIKCIISFQPLRALFQGRPNGACI